MSNLTIIGTPFSTFTRTITLGLNRKGIVYDQIATAPHSKIAETHHPMGYLPTLIIRTKAGDKEDIVELRESAAIVRYIDRIASEPSLHLEANGGILEEKMWEFVSVISSYAYNIIEIAVIKIRVAKGDEGKLSDAEIRHIIAGGATVMQDFLGKIVSLMAPAGYVFGDRLTWADYFLYPLLADLEATPESYTINARLKVWLAEMKKLPEVEKTVTGTLAVGGRPPVD